LPPPSQKFKKNFPFSYQQRAVRSGDSAELPLLTFSRVSGIPPSEIHQTEETTSPITLSLFLRQFVFRRQIPLRKKRLFFALAAHPPRLARGNALAIKLYSEKVVSGTTDTPLDDRFMRFVVGLYF
jgi:hypothetical protein